MEQLNGFQRHYRIKKLFKKRNFKPISGNVPHHLRNPRDIHLLLHKTE